MLGGGGGGGVLQIVLYVPEGGGGEVGDAGDVLRDQGHLLLNLQFFTIVSQRK